MFAHSEADFDRLELLFRRANSLPELPGSAIRLIHAIDTGAASAADLEKIISADPGLSINLLRIANTRVPGLDPPGISTIRSAIIRLGQRSVRVLAMSLILQNISGGRDVAGEFRVDRYAQHSLFVAFLSRYLYARRQLSEEFGSRWTADEIFAGGLLHDLGTALLARVAPESFGRVYSFASRTQCTLEASFSRIYERPLSHLARTAVQAWDLPDLFSHTLQYIGEPWKHPSEYTSLCCINYADYLSLQNGDCTEDWECTARLAPEVEEEMALPKEEEDKVLRYVEAQVKTYLTGEDCTAAA